MINEAFRKLEQWLFGNGYQGGELSVTADHFSIQGTCYIIYDSQRWDTQEALLILRKIYNQ